ncbi:MAG: sulfatase-like hydrolase/transferase [Eubacteriales bacterium]|nr:sulfatase-like hydrolase/transferase [Eubacteriales bacterium]
MTVLELKERPRNQQRSCARKKSGKLHKAGLVFLALLPVYIFILFEYIHFGIFAGIGEFLNLHIGAAFFSLISLYTIYLILFLISGRFIIATLIMTLLCALLAVSNYFKHTLTGDFVYPWDLIHNTGNLSELRSFVSGSLPLGNILILLFGLLFIAVAVVIKGKLRLRARWRIGIIAVVAAIVTISFNTPQHTSKTLQLFNMDLGSTSNQEVNHSENGFTGGFLVNTLSMNVPTPDGYSKNNIEKILQPYTASLASAEFSSPDIIVILSESFWDPKNLPGVDFSKNPTANFDKISKKANARSGYMYQTSYGGGTVRTEFDVITGLTIEQMPDGSVPWQYLTGNIPSYASHFKDLGYRTIFMHTYEPSFYMRNKAYPFIGFDELYFQDELTAIEGVDWHRSGLYIADDSFVSYVKHFLEQDNDNPCFLFGISMENHQPYDNKYEDTKIKVSSKYLSESTRYAVEQFSEGLYRADLALKKLVSYIDSRKKDTILIYFGDHPPTLGPDKAAYIESGFISDGFLNDKEWQALLRTPFLIYSNFSPEESEMLKPDAINEITSYNLINAGLELAGAPKSAYMEFLTDYYRAIPYYNNCLKIQPTEE